MKFIGKVQSVSIYQIHEATKPMPEPKQRTIFCNFPGNNAMSYLSFDDNYEEFQQGDMISITISMEGEIESPKKST